MGLLQLNKLKLTNNCIKQQTHNTSSWHIGFDYLILPLFFQNTFPDNKVKNNKKQI